MGIFLFQSSNNRIINNVVRDSYYAGIRVVLSSNNLISNNLVLDNTNGGIRLAGGSSFNTISGNTVSGTVSRFGIEIYRDCDNNIISGNLITNNAWGIDMWGSFSNEIFENTLESTSYVIKLSGPSAGNKI